MSPNNCQLKILSLSVSIVFLVCCHVTWAKPSVMDRVTVAKSEEGGLYNASDSVVILNVTNFESTVLGSKQAWFVEFYNRWCGHCIRFSPVWKEFAADVEGWKAVVQVAVIDCVVDANMPLCRTYNIEYFPTLRLFSAYHEKGNYGKPVEGVKDVLGLQETLVQFLEEEQLAGRGVQWPKLSPFTGADIGKIWEDIPPSIGDPKSVLFAVLIFQNSSKEFGTDLLLDLSDIPEVLVRTVTVDNEPLASIMNVSIFPSVVVVPRDQGAQELLETEDRSRNGFKLAIETFLQKKGIEITRLHAKIDPVVHQSKSIESSEIQNQVKILRSKGGNLAFLGDAEHALRYSLQHEIGSKKEMNGPILESLRNYLNILLLHFPLSTNGQKLLQTLQYDVHELTELSGKDWSQLLVKAQASLDAPAWTEREDFLGCQGSQPKYRGYPCSLWTMFHILTVNSLEYPKKSEPQDVLKAMLGYITHFFGCSECSNHFQSMAADTNFTNIVSHNDSVLWLWEAHNKVNRRLSGDSTEDPMFPKIQFPTVNHCQTCHEGESWVKHEVIKYLKSIFSHESLNDLGSSVYEARQIQNGQLSSGAELQTVFLTLLLPFVVGFYQRIGWFVNM